MTLILKKLTNLNVINDQVVNIEALQVSIGLGIFQQLKKEFS